MVAYNPFKKPIGHSLELSDLQELISGGVAEGYYVEYKRVFVEPKKIGRSLASFANTYGGWYFVGIEADKQNGNVATNVCGFDITQHHDPLSKILDPARQSLSDMPLIFPQLIDIGANRAVIAVYIPEGDDTPYITNDGRIYRRAADASDPVPESNRYTIDQLVDRGKRERDKFNDFCQDQRTFSQSEEDVPWMNVYFRPRPYSIVKTDELIRSTTIENLLKKSLTQLEHRISDVVGYSANVPLNVGYTSGRSVVLKQVNSPNTPFNGLTVQLFHDGCCKIHVPMRPIQLRPDRRLNRIFLDGEIQSTEVVKMFNSFGESGLDNLLMLKFVDFGNAATICLCLVLFYLEWLKDHAEIDLISLWSRVSMDNIWRVVPVIDIDSWVKMVDEFGLPVSHYNHASVPDMSEHPAQVDPLDHDLLWAKMASFAGNCLGFPEDTLFPMLFAGLFVKQQKMSRQSDDA